MDLEVAFKHANVELTQEQLETVLKHLQFEGAKEAVRQEMNRVKFEMQKEEIFQTFLESYTSYHTKRAYKHHINEFMEGRDVISFTRKDAQEYINEEKKKRGSASLKLRVHAISSFYNTLLAWELVNYNPFVKVKVPATIKVKEYVVPTEEEVEKYIKWLREHAIETDSSVYVTSYIVAVLLSELGIRIGAISSLEIDGKRYRAISKGKQIKGSITPKVEEVLNEFGLHHLKRISDKSHITYFRRMTQRAKNLGVISELYSPHSFRHYFAVKTYLETRDIYYVSRKLCHSSVVTTQTYLESLDVLDALEEQ